MFIMAPSGDMINFQLNGQSLSYQLRVTGYEVENVLTFQAHMASPQNIHLCMLDTHYSLSYYRYTQNKWRKIHTWTQVSPVFQTILAEKEFHVIIHLHGMNSHYVFHGENSHILDYPGHNGKGTPYRIFFRGTDDLVLIKKESRETTIQFYEQVFSLNEQHWSEDYLVCSIPKNCHHLRCWFFRDMLYFGYFLPQGNTHKLCWLMFDLASGLCSEEQLLDFSSEAGEPVLTLLNEELILLVAEPQVLVCWRSHDAGKTWNRKIELPCPWPLKLAPVVNHRQEITPYVSVEGVYNLSFRQPAVLTAKELLALSPYQF